MKASTLIAALACLLIAATSAGGQDAHDRGSKSPPQAGSGKETRLLQHLLQMNDAELVNLRQTVERIEKMSPQEKTQLRERIGTINKMAPGKVAAMRQKFEAIPKEQREAMRERWMAMSPAQREEWRTKLNEMSRAERKAIFEQQGFMPPPSHNNKKGPRPQRPGVEEPQSDSGLNADATRSEKEN
jgi:hypothetical protein